MKTLQKQVNIIWRFRCERCRSKFEMTDEERMENDRKYDESTHPEYNFPFNPMHYFDCPVCGRKEYVRRYEMHKFIVMDDGTELQEY